MGALVSLSAKQTAIQQSTEMNNPYFKWFSPNTFKYYVLIHDVSAGEDARYVAIFIIYCINTTKYRPHAIFKENELASSPLILHKANILWHHIAQFFVTYIQLLLSCDNRHMLHDKLFCSKLCRIVL